MSKHDPDSCYVPPDVLALLLIPFIGVLTAFLLPAVARLKTTEVGALYGVGVGVGILGAALLLVARLPLYRERRFWKVGPGQLDRKHRRFSWLAYVCITGSLLLLLVVWLRTR